MTLFRVFTRANAYSSTSRNAERELGCTNRFDSSLENQMVARTWFLRERKGDARPSRFADRQSGRLRALEISRSPRGSPRGTVWSRGHKNTTSWFGGAAVRGGTGKVHSDRCRSCSPRPEAENECAPQILYGRNSN